MNKIEYRLQAVLEIRQKIKQDRAKDVALCIDKLERAEQELILRQNKLLDCFKKQNLAKIKMSDQINKGIAAQIILQYRNYLDDLKNSENILKSDIELQKQFVKIAIRELENARNQLLEAANELRVIESHKYNWQTTINSRKNKMEQKISDEIGLILHEKKTGNT